MSEKRFRVGRYSTEAIEVDRQKGTGTPIMDTIANVEIAEMRNKGWLAEQVIIVNEEHRHDPSHGYRGDGRHIWTPDIVTQHVYAVVLFSK